MFTRVDTDDSGIPDFGVGEQELFQVRRRDLESFVFDQFLESVHDAGGGKARNVSSQLLPRVLASGLMSLTRYVLWDRYGQCLPIYTNHLA